MDRTGGTTPLLARDEPDSLCALTASNLASLLRSRAISASEVLEAHLDRIAAVNPKINALVTLDAEVAMDRARALDAQAAEGSFAGPLHGIPVAIKDIFDAEGMQTTFGSRIKARNVPKRDSIHVARLRAAGAIIIGKTNTSEFAFGAQTTNPIFGVTRNPYDLTRTVSGSSGGAAAALAAGLTVLADGSDLGGSIRAPAGFTGVVGLRPTARLVPLQGTALPFDNLNVPGPMARSLDDTRLMLEVMAGASSLDPWSQAIAPAKGLKARGLRVAWCLTPGGAPIDPKIAAVLLPIRVRLAELGAEIVDIDPGLGFMLEAQQIYRDWSALLEIGDGWRRNFDLFGPEIRRTLIRAEALTASDLARAYASRRKGWELMHAFFDKYDVCVWPTNSQMPYGADADVSDLDLDETSTLVTPLLGIPALSVPVGLTSDGFPVGVQFIGPRHSDLDILRIAQEVT